MMLVCAQLSVLISSCYLFGTRIGGWYDENNKISITRAEYRHAYDLAKIGKIKIVTFVRDEVWNHRQSVKELRKVLKADSDLSAEQRDRLANYPTQFATEANTLISFIDEVSRNRETANAARGQGALPVANWVHVFKTFKEIREAIDLLVLSGQSVDIAARKMALQSQLLEMLREVVPRVADKLLIPDPTIRRISKELNLRADDLTNLKVLKEKTWNQFVTLAIIAAKPRPELGHLRHVLTSDLLLRYDPETSRFHSTPEYDLLSDIIAEAANLGFGKDEGMSKLFKHSKRINSQEERRVPVDVLAQHLHRMFRLADLASAAKALVRALEGLPYETPKKMPRSPFLEQEEGIAKEEVSLSQVREWVGL